MQHLETCLLITEAGRVFLSSCNVFNCLFLLDVQSEIQLLSRSFRNLWLVCLLRFWLRNVLGIEISLSKAFVFSARRPYRTGNHI